MKVMVEVRSGWRAWHAVALILLGLIVSTKWLRTRDAYQVESARGVLAHTPPHTACVTNHQHLWDPRHNKQEHNNPKESGKFVAPRCQGDQSQQ